MASVRRNKPIVHETRVQEASKAVVETAVGVRCLRCGVERSKVTKTMAVEGGIRRYRECLYCGFTFSTTECR